MIRLSDVSCAWPGFDPVLKNIDLRVRPGEALLCCGPGGSGKSTLGRIVCGLVPRLFPATLKGGLRIAGIEVDPKTGADLFPAAGMVLQNADSQLFCATVLDEIRYGLYGIGLSAEKAGKRAKAAAGLLGVSGLPDRAPLTLSGGEKRLVALASVLTLNPAVVVLDEPLANLDSSFAQRVTHAVSGIPERGGAALVLEHRIRRMAGICKQCAILKNGQKAYDGPLNKAGRALDSAGLTAAYPVFDPSLSTAADPILELSGVSVSLAGRRVLTGIDLSIREGESVAIVGPNGAGKTTLARLFNGLLRPDRGTVRLAGVSSRKTPVFEMARRVGVCFQNPNDQIYNTTVRREILAGHPKNAIDAARLEAVCRLLRVDALMDHSPFTLSEGEKKRVALASILALSPPLLVLDEPTAGQDGRARTALARMLGELSRSGAAVVVVTHDLDFARAVAGRWVVLENGRIVHDGPPETAMTEAAAEAAL